MADKDEKLVMVQFGDREGTIVRMTKSKATQNTTSAAAKAAVVNRKKKFEALPPEAITEPLKQQS